MLDERRILFCRFKWIADIFQPEAVPDAASTNTTMKEGTDSPVVTPSHDRTTGSRKTSQTQDNIATTSVKKDA